jgi:eukaryotic-like serine/threonine-protein kinase
MALTDRLTSRFAVKAYIVIAGALFVLIALDAIILPWMIHSRAEIAIPNVVNLRYEEAQRVLLDHDLTPVNAGSTPDNSVRPGSVVYQNPPAASVVRTGRNVYLTISGGKEMVIVPNLRGRSLRDAKITLEQKDLRIGTVSYSPSPMPEETVISQGVQDGRTVNKQTSVPVTVSSGAEAVQLDVPNIVGMSLEEAQRTLTEQRLKLGAVTYRASSSLVPNTVVGQSPGPNDKVDINTPIDVVIVH